MPSRCLTLKGKGSSRLTCKSPSPPSFTLQGSTGWVGGSLVSPSTWNSPEPGQQVWVTQGGIPYGGNGLGTEVALEGGLRLYRAGTDVEQSMQKAGA